MGTTKSHWKQSGIKGQAERLLSDGNTPTQVERILLEEAGQAPPLGTIKAWGHSQRKKGGLPAIPSSNQVGRSNEDRILFLDAWARRIDKMLRRDGRDLTQNQRLGWVRVMGNFIEAAGRLEALDRKGFPRRFGGLDVSYVDEEDSESESVG